MTQEQKNELQSKRVECQIFSRVCGWLVPRHCMNPGKQAERNDMKVYKVDISLNHEFVDNETKE